MAKRKEIKKATENINKGISSYDKIKEMAEQLNQEPNVETSKVKQGNDKKKATTETNKDNKLKITKKGRISITTMIDKEQKRQLKQMSLDKGILFTDLLFDAIKQYLDGQ